MARALPLWPFILFGIIEPGLLQVSSHLTHRFDALIHAQLLGLYAGLQDPYKFYLDQVPSSATTSASYTPQAQVLVHLLLNVYVLLALLAVVCCWTSHKSTAVYYLCLLYTSPSPRDGLLSRMPSSA